MTRIISTIIIAILLCITATSAVGPRTVTLKNNCPDTYYFQVTPGSAPFNPPALATCNSNADCIAGAYCSLPDVHLCYWDVPIPNSGNYELAAGQATEVVFPYVDNGYKEHWSGNFAFCKGDSCFGTQSDCYSQGCTVVNGPANLAEITMLKLDLDYYDISNIGGINVPMAFSPDNVLLSSLSAALPYGCGTPGSPVGLNSMGNDTWAPVAPFIQNIYVVAEDGKPCSTNADCTNGSQVCGLSMQPGRIPMFQLTCGDFYGYWTANSICAKDAQNTLTPNPFGCSDPITNGPINGNKGGLYQCDFTSGSGYTIGADGYVCGCVNWQTLGFEVPSLTPDCANTNPIWMSIVYPTIDWLKAACPNCYTFPYDDKSSTFSCSNNLVGLFNSQSYTITICPASNEVVHTSGEVSGQTATNTGGQATNTGLNTYTGFVTNTGAAAATATIGKGTGLPGNKVEGGGFPAFVASTSKTLPSLAVIMLFVIISAIFMF